MLKDLYKYSFYILYKTNCFSSSWGADWRSSGILMVLCFFFITSLLHYCGVFFNHLYEASFITGYLIIMLIGLNIMNYALFYSSNQWKEIIAKYDKWPDNKNILSGSIVCIIMILLFVNFIISMELYDTSVFSK